MCAVCRPLTVSTVVVLVTGDTVLPLTGDTVALLTGGIVALWHDDWPSVLSEVSGHSGPVPVPSKSSLQRCVRHSPDCQCGEAPRAWHLAVGEMRVVVPGRWCRLRCHHSPPLPQTSAAALRDELSASLPTCTVLLISLFLAVPCVCRVRVCMFVCKTVSRDSLSVSFTRPG